MNSYQNTEKQLFIKQLKPYLYLLDEAHEATGYLVIGEKKACVIDTMNGYVNLHQAVREITDKPLIVVNTHGHPDHIFGNVYFDEAYINPKDLELVSMITKSPEFIALHEKEGVSMPPLKPVGAGDVFDLGGRTLEVYELPGHSPGAILLLLKEDRILFTGDSINHHLWLQLPGCLKPDEYIQELDKIQFLEGEADWILHGHSDGYDDISLLQCMKNGLLEICEGRTENDRPYKWFGGVDRQHPFALEEGRTYQQKNSVICYRENTV